MSMNVSFHQVKSIKAELHKATDCESYWLTLAVVHEERKWNDPQHMEEASFTLFPMSDTTNNIWSTDSDPAIVRAFNAIVAAINEAFPEPRPKPKLELVKEEEPTSVV